jgi:predicted metalloprotease with PDZ domain
MTEAVRYRVSFPRPHTHLFEVEALVPAQAERRVVQLPVWTPGSYLVREFARHVQDFSASTETGRALKTRRLDKHRFEVGGEDAPSVLRYRVYANELSVRTSHLDGSHAYFNGATLFVYADALRARRQEVRIQAPPGWQTFSALDAEHDAWIAADYDELVDSPFEVGPHSPLSFSAAGVPHQVVVWGEPKPDPERLVANLARISETQAALFGGLPLRRYLFLIYLTDKGRGGLEHRSSTALLFPRHNLTSPKGWEDFLTLASHEYFHLWNVKRIQPQAFIPLTYDREVYTSLLWAFEGITSYYDNLMVTRASLMPAERFLVRLGESLSSLWSTPGRRVQSLEEASVTAWVKYYRQDENSPNSGVSYYLKGELVAALLDLELRRRSQNARSLDDVMRLLWQRAQSGRGVPEEGVEAAASEVAQSDLSPFFDAALRGTAELDLSAFSHVGLEAYFRPRESSTDKGGSPPRVKAGEMKPKGWLGVTLRGSSTLSAVLDGSPAMESGLYADDEVVALDGFRVDGSALVARCEEKRPGESVRVTVFRRDQLLEVPVTLGQRPADAVYLSRVDAPSAEQQSAFRAWLGQAWEADG